MSNRRILSLWFPRLAAERALRLQRDALPLPFAVVADQNGAQVLTSLNPEAEAAGLRLGQLLRDATAMCPGLLTKPADPLAEADFLAVLRRWAGKFSPWVAEDPPAVLVLDLTGCAHLFGGEVRLLAEVEQDCADLGLTVRAGVADTRGAAWALAHFGERAADRLHNGDAIDQEARATRLRAGNRREWERGSTGGFTPQGVIAAPGQTRQALAALPLAALRLTDAAVEGMARLGLRRVSEMMDVPRAPLARRFGAETLRRLDQALGIEPEPVAPARAPLHFAARLTLPEPIGRGDDIVAGMDRLLPVLCARLKTAGRGARRVRMQAFRVDGVTQRIEVGLARPAHEADRIRPLLLLKLDQIDPGFGIDCLRIEAVETEPVHAVQQRSHAGASAHAAARHTEDTALDDLIGRLGARLGGEAVTRLHPAQGLIPEKGVLVLAAAWSEPYPAPWPAPRTPRPLMIWQPEPVGADEGDPIPPARFRWRRRDLVTRVAVGPERLLPEWWLDDPEWRSGPRDYWRIEVQGGERLWLYYAHGGAISGGWFCQGGFG